VANNYVGSAQTSSLSGSSCIRVRYLTGKRDRLFSLWLVIERYSLAHSLSLRYTATRTHTHTISPPHTLVLTPVLAIAHTHTLRYSRAHTHTYTIPPDQLTHTHTLSPSGTREHTHTHTLSFPRPVKANTLSHSLVDTHTLFSLTHSRSLSLWQSFFSHLKQHHISMIYGA